MFFWVLLIGVDVSSRKAWLDIITPEWLNPVTHVLRHSDPTPELEQHCGTGGNHRCCQVCIRSPHLDTPSLVKMTSIYCHFLPRTAIKGGMLVPLVTRSEVTVSFDNSSKMWDVTHPPRVNGKWQITWYELLCRRPPAWAKYPRKYTKGTNLLKYDHHSRYTKLFIIQSFEKLTDGDAWSGQLLSESGLSYHAICWSARSLGCTE